MVTGCFIVLMTASGLGFYGLAVYLNAFSNEKGWALATISLATTLFFVVGGVIGVVVARIIAVYDVRYVIVAGGVIGGVSLALLGHVEEQWQLFVDYAFFGVGFAAAGLMPVDHRRDPLVPRPPLGGTVGCLDRACRWAASSSRRPPSG